MKNPAKAAEIPYICHGHGLRFDGFAGSRELAVPNVNCTVVPFGGGPGVTGFGLNAQVAFAGRSVQLNVKLKLDPDAA